MNDTPRLIQRATDKLAKQASTMAATLGALDAGELVSEYHEVKETAPRRGQDGYRYFVARTGQPPQGDIETRREERLAMALANDEAAISVDGETIEMLTYAFPLYTTGGPKGIRAVDLVGHAPLTGRFWVVELKIAARSGYGETPLRALYEALIYAAVVEANADHVASELKTMGRGVEHLRPGILVAAPTEYWQRWRPNPRIGDWWSPYSTITGLLAETLGTPVEIVDLGRVSFQIGPDGRPLLDGELNCKRVRY